MPASGCWGSPSWAAGSIQGQSCFYVQDCVTWVQAFKHLFGRSASQMRTLLVVIKNKRLEII